MLEIRNVSKVYRSKTGEEVRALDNVSITFPESGMVFILGKSGSGKSTLLNVMGGLDSYDEGEFIIKGKSSKDFVGSDFDAYRNTFIGFIFQEYNVLDDFTVGANIGLALELQGKKATDEAVNGILAQVDLLNYAKRKPNELSGGQKQRVAIARALVKEPEIIMADEPTGALDSNTGKQIFDALKELSKTKLVLIVSHDRDFAERYADRIVELADGKIIEDVTKHEHQAERVSDGVHRVSEHILRIEGGYRLTAKDLEMINEYLARNNGDVLLSGDGRVNDELRSAAGISKDGATTVFKSTDHEKDVKVRKYEKGEGKFIRSRLPMKNAIKMGSSSLKHKKFRLFMTILLSFISFAMFGLANTVAAYENISAATASILDSNVRNASITVGVRHSTLYDDGDEYHYYQPAGINENDIKYLNEQTGMNFVPVYTGSPYPGNGGFNMESHMIAKPEGNLFTGTMSGFVNLDGEAMSQTGFGIVGRLPVSDNEIAITEFMYRQFNEYGFQNNSVKPAQSVAAGALTMNNDGSSNDIIGKKISFQITDHVYGRSSTLDLTIVGVINTEFDYERYSKFMPVDETKPQPQEEDSIFDTVLQNEIDYELNYGFHALGFATKTAIDKIAVSSANHYVPLGTHMSGWNGYLSLVLKSSLFSNGEKGEGGSIASMSQVAGSDSMSQFGNVIFFDGRTDGKLKDNEVLISAYYRSTLTPHTLQITLTDAQVQILAGICGTENWNATDTNQSFWNRLHQAKYMEYAESRLAISSVYNAVQEDAQNDGHSGELKVYWAKRLQEGSTYNPDGSGSFKNREALDNELYDKLWTDFVKDFYGVTEDLASDLNSDNKRSFAEMVLNNFYAEDLEYEVQVYNIVDVLRNTVIEKEFESKKALFLTPGSEMIKLYVDSGSNSEIDSIAAWNALNSGSEPWSYEQEWRMRQFYMHYYLNREFESYYSSIYDPVYTNEDIEALGNKYLLHMAGISQDQLLSSLTAELVEYSHESSSDSPVPGMNLTIVGFFENTGHQDVFVSDTVLKYYRQWYSDMVKEETGEGRIEDVAVHADGIWSFAIAPMPKDEATVAKLAALHYAEEGLDLDLQFRMNSAVMATLGMFDDIIEVVSQVFLWVGLGLAVFSSFLLMNFISTSISYKKREIGILRAVGARSSDVFKIFFSEAFIIAIINFVLATAASLATVIILNNYMRNQGINITLLNFGITQVLLMLGISILVAAIASFLPVWKIARKKPVDAIKDR